MFPFIFTDQIFFLGDQGALLGAGASLIGIGSDIAGSIRVPALFNGIFGHKPTPGLYLFHGIALNYLELLKFFLFNF